MRRSVLPVWLDGTNRPRAGIFIALFSFEAWCRALLMTVVPLQAHALLGDAQNVSVVYFLASGIGLVSVIFMPMLVHRIRRRWAFSLGGGLLLTAAGCFAAIDPVFFAIGLAAQVVAVGLFEVVLNLYVLDHVPRTELKAFEPKRMLFVATPFTLGPWLGVTLLEHVSPWATYGAVAVLAAVMIAFFWFLRLTDNPAVSAPLQRPPNPIRYLPRFFSQRRLFLAWGLAIGRTAFWIMFYVYVPIYMTQTGFSAQESALVISIGTMPIFLTPVWGALGRKKGIRFLLLTGYGLGAAFIVIAVLAFAWPTVAVVALILAATAASLIDGAGNVPFLRAVHPYERGEMTSVYMTFRHTAQLLTPGISVVVLSVFPLIGVFAAGAASYIGMAALARFLPKKL